MERRVAIHIPFHRWEVTRGGTWAGLMQDRAWWEARAPIFLDYTLKSLRAQTREDFDVVCTFRVCDVATWANPCVRVARDWGCKLLVKEYMDWKYPVAPNHHDFFCKEYRDYDWLVLAQLESDDCYASDVVEMLYEMPLSDGLVFHFDEGYAYDPGDGRLCEYGIADWPEAFFGYCYSRDARRGPRIMGEYRQQWGHDFYHYAAPKAPNSVEMPKGRFMQLMHTHNASSGWNCKHTTKRIQRWIEDDTERAKIMARFGIG